MQKVLHPHIINNPDVCGGSPIIVGTRFPVRSVVTYILRYGLTPEEVIAKFSFLTLAQIHDALAYFYDNQEEINTDLRETQKTPYGHRLFRLLSERTRHFILRNRLQGSLLLNNQGKSDARPTVP